MEDFHQALGQRHHPKDGHQQHGEDCERIAHSFHKGGGFRHMRVQLDVQGEEKDPGRKQQNSKQEEGHPCEERETLEHPRPWPFWLLREIQLLQHEDHGEQRIGDLAEPGQASPEVHPLRPQTSEIANVADQMMRRNRGALGKWHILGELQGNVDGVVDHKQPQVEIRRARRAVQPELSAVGIIDRRSSQVDAHVRGQPKDVGMEEDGIDVVCGGVEIIRMTEALFHEEDGSGTPSDH